MAQSQGGQAVSDDFEPGDQMDDCDIICPHCGHSYQADPCDGDANEDPSDCECEKCGKVFILYASFSVTYHTEAKEAKP
jgi:hypothetical protein